MKICTGNQNDEAGYKPSCIRLQSKMIHCGKVTGRQLLNFQKKAYWEYLSQNRLQQL